MKKSFIGRLMLDLDGTSLTQEENKLLLNPHVGRSYFIFSQYFLQEIKFKSYVREIRNLKSKASHCI